MTIIVMREGDEPPDLEEIEAHTFYWGFHPVSWFILIVNVSLGIFEWSYIIYNRFFRVDTVEEGEEVGVKGDTEEEDDDDDE